MGTEKILTLREAAIYLRLSESWMRQLVNRGDIPYHKRPGKGKKGGGLWFMVVELDAWKDSGKTNEEDEI